MAVAKLPVLTSAMPKRNYQMMGLHSGQLTVRHASKVGHQSRTEYDLQQRQRLNYGHELNLPTPLSCRSGRQRIAAESHRAGTKLPEPVQPEHNHLHLHCRAHFTNWRFK
ncbi:MAG: hypothetical protein R3C26_04620 [Calditrichia bacterium]